MDHRPAELAATRLAHEMRSWQSIEIVTRSQLTLHAPESYMPPHSEAVKTYIETSRSQRMADNLLTSPKAAIRQSGYCDGARCATVIYRPGPVQDSVIIGRSFMNEGTSGSTEHPVPLAYFYVGKVPLYEAVTKGTHLGQGRVSDRPTEVFLFPRVKWGMVEQDLVYDLDKETSVPVRVRSYGRRFNRETFEGDTPNWDWTALTLDTVDGYHLPLRSSHVSHARAGGKATAEKRSSSEIVVESVHFNKSFPASTFWPVVEPGVLVRDLIKKTTTTTAPAKEAQQGTSSPPAGTPVRAGQPDDSSSWGSTACLSLGVALLGAGVVSWWRKG